VFTGDKNPCDEGREDPGAGSAGTLIWNLETRKREAGIWGQVSGWSEEPHAASAWVRAQPHPLPPPGAAPPDGKGSAPPEHFLLKPPDGRGWRIEGGGRRTGRKRPNDNSPGKSGGGGRIRADPYPKEEGPDPLKCPSPTSLPINDHQTGR